MKQGPRRALIVDDLNVIRHILMLTLKNHGFEVMGASEGRVALDWLAKRRFDLILCDWNMPRMNGSELVTAIRVKHKDIPIIMVTAEGDPVLVKELLALGVNGYVIKPFRVDTLLAAVKKIFPDLG
ncbi:MAG: response regulator [Azonexus sp.]|nr:response regulator [Azonexus sp.]MCK6411612.1 response regulator [Azonexus sp.]